MRQDRLRNLESARQDFLSDGLVCWYEDGCLYALLGVAQRLDALNRSGSEAAGRLISGGNQNQCIRDLVLTRRKPTGEPRPTFDDYK
jgi:hypothetical protein